MPLVGAIDWNEVSDHLFVFCSFRDHYHFSCSNELFAFSSSGFLSFLVARERVSAQSEPKRFGRLSRFRFRFRLRFWIRLIFIPTFETLISFLQNLSGRTGCTSFQTEFRQIFSQFIQIPNVILQTAFLSESDLFGSYFFQTSRWVINVKKSLET